MTEPFPLTEAQRDNLAWQKRRRAMIRAAAAKDSNAHGSRLARALLASDQRAPDTPVDVARRTLQRAGYKPVHNASVTGGSRDQWVVGARLLTTAEMLELAR